MSTINDFGDIQASFTPAAESQAQASLRDKNKNEWTCVLTIVGNTQVVDGTIFEVEDFGQFDGKYIAYEVSHNIDGGYTTKIKGRKVLGY